jgi:hypothetical protein
MNRLHGPYENVFTSGSFVIRAKFTTQKNYEV